MNQFIAVNPDNPEEKKKRTEIYETRGVCRPIETIITPRQKAEEKAAAAAYAAQKSTLLQLPRERESYPQGKLTLNSVSTVTSVSVITSYLRYLLVSTYEKLKC